MIFFDDGYMFSFIVVDAFVVQVGFFGGSPLELNQCFSALLVLALVDGVDGLSGRIFWLLCTISFLGANFLPNYIV